MHPVELDSPARRGLRGQVREFINAEVRPHAAAWESSRSMPHQLLAALGQRGWLGLSLPTAVGGQGGSLWDEVVLAEELALSRALGWSLSVLAHAHMAAPLVAWLGTPVQVEKFLRPALRGEGYLALAATESATGSDLLAAATVAEPRGSGFYISGEKCFISNGSVARHVIVLVRTENSSVPWSHSLFIVDGTASGLQREALPTVGLHSGDTARLIFRECFAAADRRLGPAGGAFTALLQGLQRERLLGAVAVNALAADVLATTVTELQGRRRFGEPLSHKQAIRHRLAELFSALAAGRQFAYAVCEAYVRRQPIDQEIVMLKIYSYETAQRIIRECAHLHGADAFVEGHWLAAANRDAEALTLVAGTSEVMRDLLAGLLQL